MHFHVSWWEGRFFQLQRGEGRAAFGLKSGGQRFPDARQRSAGPAGLRIEFPFGAMNRFLQIASG